jgi:hypothetical protein
MSASVRFPCKAAAHISDAGRWGWAVTGRCVRCRNKQQHVAGAAGALADDVMEALGMVVVVGRGATRDQLSCTASTSTVQRR